MKVKLYNYIVNTVLVGSYWECLTPLLGNGNLLSFFIKHAINIIVFEIIHA